MKPRRPALQASALFQKANPWALGYEILRVYGSSFFTNLPATKAMENPAKYTKVNKVEVMTFWTITFLKEGRATQIYIMEKLFDSRTMGRCYAAKCNN